MWELAITYHSLRAQRLDSAGYFQHFIDRINLALFTVAIQNQFPAVTAKLAVFWQDLTLELSRFLPWGLAYTQNANCSYHGFCTSAAGGILYLFLCRPPGLLHAVGDRASEGWVFGRLAALAGATFCNSVLGQIDRTGRVHCPPGPLGEQIGCDV
jgi:hypothetical protein